MKIKNNYKSHIGFGDVAVMPGEVKKLPKGYGKNEKGELHSTIAFYISKKWIEIVEDDAESDSTNSNKGTKSIERMNKTELTALAAELGIEFAESDTNPMLIEKIKAAQKNGE